MKTFDGTEDDVSFGSVAEMEESLREEEQNICGFCGQDIYGVPAIYGNNYKAHHTCLAIAKTKLLLQNERI